MNTILRTIIYLLIALAIPVTLVKAEARIKSLQSSSLTRPLKEIAIDGSEFTEASVNGVLESDYVHFENINTEWGIKAFTIKRLNVLSQDAEITVHDRSGLTRSISPPAINYYSGVIDDDKDSLVILSASPSGGIRGIVKKSNGIWEVNTEALLESKLKHIKLEKYTNKIEPNNLLSIPSQQSPNDYIYPPERKELASLESIREYISTQAASDHYIVPIAIETDAEFYNRLGTDERSLRYTGQSHEEIEPKFLTRMGPA